MDPIKTAGIIAEYNSFHNGHQYQIEEIRRQTGADYIIAAMSGDFVQRGEPAIFDKYTRSPHGTVRRRRPDCRASWQCLPLPAQKTLPPAV